jgi:hypothetical protein
VSNESKTSRKRKYNLPSVNISDQEAQQVKAIMRRLRGRDDSGTSSSEESLLKSDRPSPDEGLSSSNGLSPNPRPVLGAGPSAVDGPIFDTKPKFALSSSPNDGPARDESLAHHGDGPLPLVGPTRNETPDLSFSVLNSLPDVDGFILWFHQLTDYLASQLTPHEQAVYLQLYRLSWGFDNSEAPSARCTIGFPRLAERSSMHESGARLAAKGLIRKGLVRKVGAVFGKNREQGIEWEVFAPPALVKHRASLRRGLARNEGPAKANGPLRPAPIKELNTQRENTQTQGGVSVGSRFSLEECRRYAEYLKQTGQGITNPGGYATKIFRSGEADAFIEGFLSPPAQVDISRCPDCRGTGFIYVDPSNHDRGVRPCRHDGLRTGAQ